MTDDRIARVESFQVPPRWLFVRIETEQGVVGWGEGSLEGHADTVAAAIGELREILIGQNAGLIEDRWQVMTKGGFYRGGPVLSSAVAGIDQALWDIAGKSLGVPIYQLLGGRVRDRVRVYSWVGGDEPAEVADAVRSQVEAGMTAVKMNASGRIGRMASAADLAAVIGRCHAARDVLGAERDFAIDLHGRFTLANARRLCDRLGELHPLFVEEPLLPEHTHLLHQVIDHTAIPIATGERLYARHEFLPALNQGTAVVQPDIAHAGGISEVRRIASLAEVFDAQLAPHCPLGPIALAACLQVGSTSPNLLIQEQSGGIHYNNHGADLLDYLMDPTPLTITDGHIPVPVGPGLGIEVDEDAIRTADKRRERWRNPIWRHVDGSFAEW